MEYEFDFSVESREWQRGKAQDIADDFANATHDHRDIIIFTTRVTDVNPPINVDPETEAYRIARNRIDALIEANGWDAGITRVQTTATEPEQDDLIENPTIEDIDRWDVLETDEEPDDDIINQWRHSPTDQWLALVKDHPDSRRDWHNEMHADDLRWVVRHQYTTIGRYETEAEAIESAFEWMQANPYALDPANSYM